MSNNLHQVKVWDRTTRVFHWINAISFICLMGLGLIILNGKSFGFSTEGKILIKIVHTLFGYVFAANLAWRLLWGFIGNEHARWKNILPIGEGFKSQLRELRAARKAKQPSQILGHSPSGRIAVSILILLLSVQAVTGLVLAGTDIYYPPFGSFFAEWVAAAGVNPADVAPYQKDLVDAEAYKEMRAFRKPFIRIHVLNFYALSAFAVLHLMAVVRAEFTEGGGLISAMVTGRKTLPGKDE